MILPKWLYKEMIKRNFDDGFKQGYNDALRDLILDLSVKVRFGKLADEEGNSLINWITEFRKK